MKRLIHNQLGLGALLVDDIDDGLPNKTAHRLGGTADPNAYQRDGYANAAKQPCYVPRVKAGEETVAGFIDLNETQRVILSAEQGKISGLQQAGLITIVDLVAADIVVSAISGATLGAPAAGDVTIAGTTFLSVSPDITTVHLAGAGVGDVTLTQTEIEAVAPGAVGATSIVIDSTLVPSLAVGDTIQVRANGLLSNIFTLT
jgi:hypothetical protein